jgi:general secretion pathway protein F
MPNYSYRGVDKSGKPVVGQMVAEHERAAIDLIKAQGMFPTEVKSAESDRRRPERANGSAGKRGSVNGADLTVFSRQLANLVASGLPLMRTFMTLADNTESVRLREVLNRMQQDVHAGKSLWEGFAEHPSVFPPLYVSMVKAGEASGQLSSVLKWLADYMEKEQARKMQIRSAIAYPTLLVTVGALAVSILIAVVVPKFQAVFEEFNQALPMPTVVLLKMSGLLTHWWWAIILGIVALVFGLKRYSKTPPGRLRMDGWSLRTPLFGKLKLKSGVSRFARTTATLLQGGVPLLDSMVVVREVVGNEVLARGADQVREGMREGESFANRLRETGVFPPLLTDMVAVGEETGELEDVLVMVANSYDVEVDATLKSIVSLLEPLIIVTVGGAIAFIILAMLLPVFQINLMGS